MTQEHLKAPWASIGKRAFFCAFCQKDLEMGDEFRMIFTNDLKGAGGNPLACGKCVTEHGVEGLRERWQAMWQEYKTKFRWWSVR